MKQIFECEGCGGRSTDRERVARCEAQPTVDFDVPIAVGSVVACAYPAYSWWEGDEAWRVHKDFEGRKFLHGFYPLWVIVDKRIRDHHWQYVLWTPSHAHGFARLAWTGPRHYRMHYEREATDDEKVRARAYFDAETGQATLL